MSTDDQDQQERRRYLQAGAGLMAGLASVSALAQTLSPPKPDEGKARPDGRFAGKVLVITGAMSGIGETTAHSFARKGAKVGFCGRSVDRGRAVETAIQELGGDAVFVRADVRKLVDVQRLVDEAVKRHERIDIAFNNAGISSARNAPMAEQPTDDFQDVLDTAGDTDR